MQVFSTIFFALMIFVIVFAYSLISNICLQSVECETKSSRLEAVQPVVPPLEPPLFSDPRVERKVTLLEKKLRKFEVYKSTKSRREFDVRIDKFLRDLGQCQVQFFMTWISPAASFGRKEFFAMESIFKAHSNACLIILSKALDSERGRLVLKPLLDRGYRIAAVTPDTTSLFNNTPAEAWLNDIQSGNKNPGRIPLAQNLSNLIRFAVLYKYGGVYLDTDFIVLRDFTGLRNIIGAQSVDGNGNWTRLNNAVLVFDKNHPLLYEFMKEFQITFDGNRWGHNGPYLVSRVVARVEANALMKQQGYNFSVLPPMAFYPVDWIRIDGFFKRPNDPAFSRWAKAKLLQLSGETETYGIHLWNRQTGRAKIEEGSIIAKLISDHCIICQNIYAS